MIASGFNFKRNDAGALNERLRLKEFLFYIFLTLSYYAPDRAAGAAAARSSKIRFKNRAGENSGTGLRWFLWCQKIQGECCRTSQPFSK